MVCYKFYANSNIKQREVTKYVPSYEDREEDIDEDNTTTIT